MSLEMVRSNMTRFNKHIFPFVYLKRSSLIDSDVYILKQQQYDSF